MQQVPQPPKSMFPYSVGSSFSTPRSGSTKWQTNIVLSFDSVDMKKSYRDGWKFLRNSLVKLLVYGKQIWRWNVGYTCSFLRNQYYLYINYIIKRRKFQAKQNQFFIKRMNVCFKRIKKIAKVSLSEQKRKLEIYFAFSLTFLCVNFTAISKGCFNKNLFSKISQHSPENTWIVNIFFLWSYRPSAVRTPKQLFSYE